MRKATTAMKTVCSIILLSGFLSLANGYFRAPGMENLDSPYDHLFRGGPSQMEEDWDDMTSGIQSHQHSWNRPEVYSFYHKFEDKDHIFEPFNDFQPSGRIPEISGFSADMSEINRLPSVISEPNEESSPMGKAEERVVGGRDVAEGEIPWQISLQRKSMKSGRIFHICGGSIISKEWVVTAAHCVALALLSNYRVVAATTNLRDENRIKSLGSSDYSTHKVVDVHIHDEYDMFRFRNDIALLRIEPPFDFSNKIQSIALPSPGHRAHGYAYASGWGLLQEGVRVTPSRLQAVELPIVSDSKCREAYGDNLVETMICAGYREGGRSVCQGDSGGPLFQTHGGQAVLIGVVSWGVGCARPGKPGVYTEVSYYVDWIDQTTGGIGRHNAIH